MSALPVSTRFKLYGFWRSSATWRVRIGLAYKGVSYDYEPLHLRRDGGEQNTDAYGAKNPMREVPLLEFEHEGRLVRLGQSMAILEYLDETIPAPSLLPTDPWLRARCRQIAEMINAGIQPLQNTRVQLWVENELGADSRAWVRHWVTRALPALEAVVAETAGRFAVGDSLSLADLYLIPELQFARRFEIPLDAYPTLLRVEEACAVLPAFIAAHAKNQPDAGI